MGLPSTLQDLVTVNSALSSYLGAWVSTDDLVDYLGTDTSLVIQTTGLAVQAGEDSEAWALISESETNSQTAADLESLSWVLLDDLVCDLTENAFVPVQSILIYRPGGSSGAAVYISLTDLDFTSGDVRFDHTLAFPYADIVGVSSDPGLCDDLGTATPPSENHPSDPHLDAST